MLTIITLDVCFIIIRYSDWLSAHHVLLLKQLHYSIKLIITHVSVITAERTCWASSPLPAIFDEGLLLDDQRLTTLNNRNQSNAVQ